MAQGPEQRPGESSQEPAIIALVRDFVNSLPDDPIPYNANPERVHIPVLPPQIEQVRKRIKKTTEMPTEAGRNTGIIYGKCSFDLLVKGDKGASLQYPTRFAERDLESIFGLTEPLVNEIYKGLKKKPTPKIFLFIDGVDEFVPVAPFSGNEDVDSFAELIQEPSCKGIRMSYQSEGIPAFQWTHMKNENGEYLEEIQLSTAFTPDLVQLVLPRQAGCNMHTLQNDAEELSKIFNHTVSYYSTGQ